MKILIVYDHAIFREGLRRILSDEFKSATFGDASNATEAIELATACIAHKSLRIFERCGLKQKIGYKRKSGPTPLKMLGPAMLRVFRTASPDILSRLSGS
jgi:hypothetical protein